MADSGEYPIVLVRGFAMFKGDIETAANQAFLGFEQGYTGRYPTNVIDPEIAARTDEERFAERIGFADWFFESVVMRLQGERGYADAYVDNSWATESDAIGMKSIWPLRYYDLASEQFGDDKRHFITRYAKELRRFILEIRDRVCGDDADERAAFKVNLVTHSQGGLLVRAYLRNICAHLDPELIGDEAATLEIGADGCDPLVNRVFNYGTPQNGIEVLGINSLLDPFGGLIRADVFDRKTMRKYLGIAKNDPANSLNGAFPPEDMFNLIGSDWAKYDVAPSRWVTKGESDGLVKQKNAWTVGSPRATVHKAHGGPDGLVNSEEGYQNLQRFLFGDWRADLKFLIDEYALPEPFDGLTFSEPGRMKNAVMLADASLDVRNGLVPLHERVRAKESAIPIQRRHLDGDEKQGVHLASTFLWSALSRADAPGGGKFLRFNLETDVRFTASSGRFGRGDYVRNALMIRLYMDFDIQAAAGQVVGVKYDDREDGQPGGVTAPEIDADRPGARLFQIPVASARTGPGSMRGRLLLRLRPHRS
jgi:hypothetical protein